jgi:hypothetical protein
MKIYHVILQANAPNLNMCRIFVIIRIFVVFIERKHPDILFRTSCISSSSSSRYGPVANASGCTSASAAYCTYPVLDVSNFHRQSSLASTSRERSW